VITLNLRCSCGNKAKFSSSQQKVIDDMDRLFRNFHTGDGHEVSPAPVDGDSDPSP
jgi:hypothetical protein